MPATLDTAELQSTILREVMKEVALIKSDLESQLSITNAEVSKKLSVDDFHNHTADQNLKLSKQTNHLSSQVSEALQTVT